MTVTTPAHPPRVLPTPLLLALVPSVFALGCYAVADCETPECWPESPEVQPDEDQEDEDLGIEDSSQAQPLPPAPPAPTDPPAGPRVRLLSIAAGNAHTCAVTDERQLWCWGLNNYGQVGPNLGRIVDAPVHIADAGEVVEVAATDRATCTLDADGRARCRGHLSGPRYDTEEPVGIGFRRIVGGDDYVCAINAESRAVCWGAGVHGEPGFRTQTPTPSVILELPPVHAIAAGGKRICAITEEDALWCWFSFGSRHELVDREVAQVTVGREHFCSRTFDGRVRCRSNRDDNTVGQLGGPLGSDRTAWVTGIDDATEIVAGGWHTCARRASGELWCWGANVDGQVGDGTRIDRHAPARAESPTHAGWGRDIVGLALGGCHSCAITGDAAIYCWGTNDHGELGVADRRLRVIPTAVYLE